MRRIKTETDKEIVASNEARRRIKLTKEVHVKMGIKEKHNEKKRRNQKKEKKRDTQM